MGTPSFVISLVLIARTLSAAEAGLQPHLEKRGDATQLMVDGKPFLILGAELHNSSSSSLDYMAPIWPKLKAIPLNAVLTPLSWELVEPQEGKFDFTLMDGLIRQAREQHLKVVFLWLAAWKNGMSSYAPQWGKSDTRRFPRVVENSMLAYALFASGNYGRAIAVANRALELEERHWPACFSLALIYVQTGQLKEAAEILENGRRIAPWNSWMGGLQAGLYAHSGNVARSSAVMEEFRANSMVQL